MIGFMPVQSQAGFFGFIPSCSGYSAHFIGAHLLTRNHQVSHVAHILRVIAYGVAVVAE